MVTVEICCLLFVCSMNLTCDQLLHIALLTVDKQKWKKQKVVVSFWNNSRQNLLSRHATPFETTTYFFILLLLSVSTRGMWVQTWVSWDLSWYSHLTLSDRLCLCIKMCICMILPFYLLHRCVFHSVCVVMVVDDFKVFDSLSFGWATEVAIQVGLSCSFGAHSEMSGLI